MRPRDAVILLCVAAAAMMLPNGMDSAARACSVFALTADGDVVVGRNLDWHDPMPGAVLVNVRGTEKSVLPWQGNWPASQDSPPVVWSSRFGSVTFTCYGRDFIESGMNEAGLIVAEASFEAVYAPDDGRPGVSCAQWMQFQLDNYATVAELLEHVGELRLDGEGWHYLVADASGACAVIEHQKGQPLVYSLDEVPVSALTNTSYAQALTHVPLDVAFGGEFDIGEGNDSYGRFFVTTRQRRTCLRLNTPSTSWTRSAETRPGAP